VIWTGCRQSRRPLQPDLIPRLHYCDLWDDWGEDKDISSTLQQAHPTQPLRGTQTSGAARDRLSRGTWEGDLFRRSTNLPRESAIYASQSLYFSYGRHDWIRASGPFRVKAATIRFSTAYKWVRELPNTRNYLLARQGKLTLGLRIGLEDSLSLHQLRHSLAGLSLTAGGGHGIIGIRATIETRKTRTPGLGSWSYIQVQSLA
jgi:hypothetical protein